MRFLIMVALLCARGRPAAATATEADAPAGPRAKVNRFNATGAYGSVRRQVELGPRPAGSAASRRLAERIRRALPRGRFEAVPGGLRNVVGTVPGSTRARTVVVGAHYDTKDLPGFVGANDGAAGTAILTQLARTVKPRRAAGRRWCSSPSTARRTLAGSPTRSSSATGCAAARRSRPATAAPRR